MDVVMHTPSRKVADHVADRPETLIPRKFSRVVMARIRPHFASDPVICRVTPVIRPEGEPSYHLVKLPWFLVETVDTVRQQVIRREYLENPYVEEEKKKGLLVGNWLLLVKPDEIVVPGNHQGTAAALLREAGGDIQDG